MHVPMLEHILFITVDVTLALSRITRLICSLITDVI